MLIGIPKEIKTHEYRVGLVPSSVHEFTKLGHDAVVEHAAGSGIGFSDEDYINAIKQKQVEAVKVETATNIAERAIQEKAATITQAEAQAEAQRLQRETLSDQVLEKTELDVRQTMADALKISAEKGVKIVPETILGGNSNFLYSLAE